MDRKQDVIDMYSNLERFKRETEIEHCKNYDKMYEEHEAYEEYGDGYGYGDDCYDSDPIITLFHFVCQKGSVQVLEYMIEKYGRNKFAPIFQWWLAFEDGNLEKIKFLDKTYGISDYNKGLCKACSMGNIDIIKYMIEKGANAFNNALYECATFGNLNVIKYFIEERKVDSLELDMCMLYASRYGRIDIVKYLLDIDMTLFCSMFSQDVCYLLNRGLDCNKVKQCLEIIELYPHTKNKREYYGNSHTKDILMKREKRNEGIKNALLSSTKLYIDIIDVICIFTEY